mmetsp:Transcript_16846/g.38838  ORF Transcript_16846/g.38838 Transcript_16846/m.38838 type:complete len:403 (-) Transcript_16846:6898-8106(-)
MNIILLDTLQASKALRPFSYTRALAKMRVGIRTIEEKWKYYLQGEYSFLTASYLRHKFPCIKAKYNLCVNSTILPNEVLIEAIRRLENNQKLVKEGVLIATLCDQTVLQDFLNEKFDTPSLKEISFQGSFTQIRYNWDLFLLNEEEIRKDFRQVCEGRSTQPIQDQYTITYHKKSIFLEEGVTTKSAILNAESGPIYIGRNVNIQERAVIKGPVAICEEAQISVGARINNATTIGPFAKAGGEISNSVIWGYSNKKHDGFMGNSVIGEWCNLGAGTNTSNLRNDYDYIKTWNEYGEVQDNTGLQFCGIFIGDYSRCAVNTIFNAGTTVGVSSNLFGTECFNKTIPSFTWSMPGTHMQTYLLDRALEAAERIKRRRMVPFTKQDEEILSHIFMITSIYRPNKE